MPFLKTSPAIALRIPHLGSPINYRQTRIAGHPRSSHSLKNDAVCFRVHQICYQTSIHDLAGSRRSLEILDFGLPKAYEQLM